MKKIIPLILSILICTACNSDVKKITRLEKQLKVVKTKQDEKRILNELWSIAYNSEEIKMNVKATDFKGNNVINNLSKATMPVKVKISLYTSVWSEKMEFIPLDIENVYILLRE